MHDFMDQEAPLRPWVADIEGSTEYETVVATYVALNAASSPTPATHHLLN
jgi:hypothetical protein